MSGLWTSPRATGFASPYVSNVASGRYRTITVTNALKFARVFNCGVSDLFPAPDEEAVA